MHTGSSRTLTFRASDLHRRPRCIPLFWRDITPRGLLSYRQKRDWLLVLQACGLPYMLISQNRREHIYIPPVPEQKAFYELHGYEAEAKKTTRPAGASYPVHDKAPAVLLFLLPLIVWHGLRCGWWAVPSFLPSPALWGDTGALDSILLSLYGQYYRLITALTLHVDDAHLWSNMTFGALFLVLLARIIGAGRAAWLTLLSGTAGNALALLLRKEHSISMGFSTALFACVGLLSGIMASRSVTRHKAVMPMAAGAALLALLGTEGENTHYAAHVGGLLCGLAAGLAEGYRQQKGLPCLPQWACALLALLLPVLAWFMAFSA